MTLTETIEAIFAKKASSPAQRAVNAGAPDAAENPTDGQKRVGNYRKVHLNLDGFRISIENPKGSVRSGTAPDGTKWSNTLACDYGDIRGTESVDGDPVDIYLSDHPEKGAVFVIDQIDPKTKKFDEHKVMYGFDSIEDAKKTYLACYQKGWGGLGWITPVTKAEFRKWIDSSIRKTKPFHEYASVTPIVDPIKVKAAEEKTAQDIDDDIDESVIVRFNDNKNNKHGYVRAYDGELSLTNNKDEALVYQHEEIAQNKIEVYCADGGYKPENFEVISVDPRADEPYEDLDKSAQVKQDDLMEGVPAGVKLRSFIDAPATRTAIMDNVLEAVKNRFPIEDDDVRLELKDIKYEGPTSYTLEQQKQALLNNRRLGCSMVGTWRLTDKKTGQVLDERREGVIRVPYYTDRGTIINNGNEYTVISQARLSPGVYVRRKQNGELESQFNVANGLGFRIGLDRETGALNMTIGQGHVPLYPVLHALGVSDADIRKSWGDEVANVNIGKFDPRALDKVYARYAGRKADMNLTPQEKAMFITDALAGSGLDPEVVTRTLGLNDVKGVTGAVMLRAAQKLLNINRGAEDPDERDNPRFSKFYGVEDMMRERIEKDAGRLTKSLLFRAKRDRSLNRIARNALGPYLDTFLSGSGLAMPGEEANPLSILTQQSRITRLGEGGISSADLVTPEARNVQGDYLGYVDFISGPESFGIGIDVRAALGTMKGSDNRLYNKMVDLRTGKTRYVALDDAASHTVAFPGQDPKSPSLYAMRKGVPTMVPRDEVDYMVPGFGNTVSAGINMTPMPTAVQAGRQFYMSKFWEQYLPQKEGEVPLVDSLMDDGKTTYSEFYGRKVGCLTAPFSGTVVKANDKEIVIRGKDGQTHTSSLVQGLPFNRLSGITYIPQVKKGDEVQEGGILANSNFTDAKTGAMNMGRNLKVAVLPAPEGVSSYEDAIVISESAAKKLATSRLYNFEQDTKNGVQVARNKYLAAFPQAYTKKQADTIDENGVVKVGTVLHRDDPMILAIGPKMLSAENAQLGKLSSVLRNALTDKSTKWEHDWPGVVTDVVAGPHGAKVIVKSEPPVKIGDKLCYDEETEVLTTRGWLHFRDVTLDDNVATLNPETFEFDYIKPSKVQSYEHKGKMYKIKSQLIDLTVTPNHNMFVQRRGHKSFELISAEDIFGKRVSYKKDGKWVGQDVEWFDFPPYSVGHRLGMITKPGVRMRMDTFLMLLGMYLSEGNSFNNVDKGAGIAIAQIKPSGIQECRRALDEAGVRYTYGGHQFTLSGRWLYNYFSQFGYSYEKYIPSFVFGLSRRQQEILFKWMMWGDGHSEKGQPKTYTTSSKRLADDFQRLCLHVGRSARIVHRGHPGDTHGCIEGRVITTKHDVYSVQIISSKLTPTVNHGHVKNQHIQHEEYVDYDGRVYCCTMPKWHVIFVRRGGNVCWCGNSPENGLKGVVGGIIPDDKMPRDAATNERYDMLMNPMGFLSRVAPGQIMLMNLAKVAKKTGKQIRIPQTPPPEGWQAYTERLMAENGVKDTADVFDPQTGRTIKNVGDGYVYVKAFHHLAEKKFSARGVEGAYTQDEQPAKGGDDGAKRISGFDNLALLSHGATEVIKDSMVTRGQCFDEETEVLTRHGWKLWREVSTSDELLTKAKEGDGTAFYEVPERLVVNDYDGIMYGYENRHIDWLVTPDHDLWGINCLVSKNKTYRHYRTFKAKDIFGKEGTIDAFGAIYPGSLTRNHVLEFRDDSTTRGKGSVKEVKMDLFDYCAFMGWWLSEGCASYDGQRGEIRISQDAAIHQKEFAEILSLGVKIGLGNGCLSRKTSANPFGGRSPIGTPTLIRWRSKPLALHLMKFGTRAWDKRIPEVIFEAPLDCRMEFLRCYSLGDGCRRCTGHGHDTFNDSIGTASPMMMHDLQRLAVISGLSAHIGLDKKAGEYNYKHDYYRVVISGNTKETTIRKMPSARFKGHYKLHYSGRVYCATMSTGLVYVRRNGKCMWSGNCNDEYWRRYRLGLPVEEPGVPFIYQKFLNTLRAGGVNVVEKGDVTSIMPQTDKDIDELAQGRVLENSQMVDSDMVPVKGGMFDLGKTGGMGGNRWSMIILPEAVPNPMMEEPVRRVLGLTSKKLEAILSGREELDGKTGGDAIKSALSNLNVDRAIERARADIENRRGAQRDNAVKVLGYLKAAKKIGISPDSWMITRVPVLPPMFRPVAKMGDVALVPDMNELYKELIEMKQTFEKLSKELPAYALADERMAVYGAVKAAYGLGESITAEGRAKNLKGAIRQVIGTIPKFGMYQSKVISKTQDNVGRSVTVPDKNLDMDQIGIPEDMAWEMYKPHVERKLVQRGYSPVTAKGMIDERNATARHLLEEVMEERPVLMDRAPTWHKFNIMAFKPHIVNGRSIHVCPLIDSGFNMDHDGDLSRSPYITTWISDKIFDTLEVDSATNLCYNPCITQQVIKDRTMYKENAVINGVLCKGTVVSLRWDEFPHYDNPTMNSHPNAHFYLVPEGVAVRAYDEKQGKIVWAPVKYWSHHGVNDKLEIVTVELSSGRQILTDDDPRGVYGIDPDTMTFGRWRPKDAIGKFVPRCVKDELIEESMTSVDLPESSSRRTDSLKDEMPLDRQTGWLIGAIIGDGWSSKVRDRYSAINFCYDRAYNDLGSSFTSSMNHAFAKDGTRLHIGETLQTAEMVKSRYGDAVRLCYSNAILAEFIDNMVGHGAANKHLPIFWQRASHEFRLGLLEGLLDTDGTIALNKAKTKKYCQLICNYTSISMTLATEIQYLCRTLGVDSKLTTQKTPKGGKCWQVSISTKNLKSLGLALRSPHKAKALSDAIIHADSSAGGRKYMIPVPVRELKKVSGILLALDRSAYITLNRTGKKGYAPTTVADKIAKVLRGAPELQTDLWRKWLELYDNIDNVVWERVDGFTCTGMYEEGFDLTVPGYETFMNSEGIILSNTVNIHVPASMKAARQAMDKMLPSKNLFSLTDLKSVRYKPEKEQISGLWALTRGRTRKPVRVFGSKQEAIAAYRNGEIGPNDPVEIA